MKTFKQLKEEINSLQEDGVLDTLKGAREKVQSFKKELVGAVKPYVPSKESMRDFGRGAFKGATWGTGENIMAKARSVVNKTDYGKELEKEKAANVAAEKRSPVAFSGGEIVGSVATPAPLAGGAIKAATGLVKGSGLASAAVKKGISAAGNIAADTGYETAIRPVKTKMDMPATSKPVTNNPIQRKAVPVKPLR
jgi:hypothetical protein